MSRPAVEAAADPLFRRVVSAVSSLAIGAMLASVGAVTRGTFGKLEFHWSWAIPPLLIAGLVLGHMFWRLLWRAQREGSAASSNRLRRFTILLGIVAVGSFAYPIRYVQGNRLQEVLIGLGLAIVVLTGIGLVIYKTIRWLNEGEPRDGECERPPED